MASKRKKPAAVAADLQNIEQRAQARDDGKLSKAARGGATRWKGITPEQRKEQMQAVAKARPKVTPEQLDALAWLLENRETLGEIVENFKAYQVEKASAPNTDHLQEHNAPASSIPQAVVETRTQLDTCSVCLGPLYDLDKPCETCTAAGRIVANPDELHALQSRVAKPSNTAPTVYDLPRLSNAVPVRPPLPPPPPPVRAYTAQETCRSCGRLQELHASHGGPILHAFEQQAV